MTKITKANISACKEMFPSYQETHWDWQIWVPSLSRVLYLVWLTLVSQPFVFPSLCELPPSLSSPRPLPPALSRVFHWRRDGRERIGLFWQVAQLSLVSPLYCCSVAQSADCSTAGFPVHHQLPEFAQTHVHWFWWWHPTISSCVVPFSSCPWSFPASRSFPMSQLFPSGGQSIGVSASTSVLPMNIQDWFPLGWTGWISLHPKDSQESSPTPQFKRSNSLVLSFLYSPTLTFIHDHRKNHNLD